MGFDYRGKVAVVTGASSGIGRILAVDLARRGTTVIAAARRKELVDEVAEECRRHTAESSGVVLDVSDRAAVESMCREALDRHGKVDVLVNNAGIPLRVHATRLTVEDVEHVMGINYFGAVYATLALLPSMLKRRAGHIVNVGSVAGRTGSPREAAYSASKFALSGWTEVLAADLKGTGVKVHLIVPGAIKTEIWDKLQEPASFDGKFIAPEEIVAAVRDCLETGKFERWVPRRLGFLPVFRSVAPRGYISGIARFDKRADRKR